MPCHRTSLELERNKRKGKNNSLLDVEYDSNNFNNILSVLSQKDFNTLYNDVT